MLKIPNKPEHLQKWIKEIIDESMRSASERGMIYNRAAQYYYQGSTDSRASLYNKTAGFIDKLSGFLMQPTDVRFNITYDSSQDEDVLQRASFAGEKLTTDFRTVDGDTTFSENVTWSLINGCQLQKVIPDGDSGGFKVAGVHPANFGVLNETTVNLDEQEGFTHVSYPTMSRLRTMLLEHPRYDELMARIEGEAKKDKQEDSSSYFHALVVGGLQPLGDVGDLPAGSSGIVNVFPVPAPWLPDTEFQPTVKLCETWLRDRDRDGDWTTIQTIYPDIVIEGEETRRNLSRVPGKHPFVKVQAVNTPGYFFGRPMIAAVAALQDVLSKRLRDLKVMWDRNVAAPQVFSGFTSVTEEQYYKLLSEGGFINDPNPNAKAQKLLDPPPENYLQELEFLLKLFDDASGFSPIMSGQGEPGVRAGVHAQTLVRTSSPHLIAQAARIERQLADTGYLGFRIIQAMDPLVYKTEGGQQFLLRQLPAGFQVQIDSHSASPAFAEDSRQIAIALARAGAIDAEDLIHLLHPPSAELLLARLKDRQKAQAKQAKEEEQSEIVKGVLGIPQRGHAMAGGGRRGK